MPKSDSEIRSMVLCIDQYLEREHLNEVTAVEAAQVLERAGLLKDYPQRRGLPLRKLLRAGRFNPHAYKKNGHWWYIPHSKS